MPKNNNLEVIKPPMVLKFDKGIKTEFKNNIKSIKIDMMFAPSIEELKSYIPYFVDATWSEDPLKIEYTEEQKEIFVREMFEGKYLPTAKETITFVFRISGITLQEVTHILRHRMASFSADCSADKWWTEKDCLVPYSIENSPEFYERYKKITEESKQLYADMIDSRKISIMDARFILTRNLETFYYMKIDFGNLIAFINQRKDVQIQPEADNIMAYEFTRLLLEKYGDYVSSCFDFSNPSAFYQRMARTGKTSNIYFPDDEVDNFEWNEDDFLYKNKRSEVNGTSGGKYNVFDEMQKEYFDIFKRYGVKVPEKRK